MTSTYPDLLSDILRFTEDVGMSEITFGRKAMGDPHFVRDLRCGRRLWPETEAKARRFIDEYKPEQSGRAA